MDISSYIAKLIHFLILHAVELWSYLLGDIYWRPNSLCWHSANSSAYFPPTWRPSTVSMQCCLWWWNVRLCKMYVYNAWIDNDWCHHAAIQQCWVVGRWIQVVDHHFPPWCRISPGLLRTWLAISMSVHLRILQLCKLSMSFKHLLPTPLLKNWCQNLCT